MIGIGLSLSFAGLGGQGGSGPITPPAPAYEAWAGPGWFDFSDASTVLVEGGAVQAIHNKRAEQGDMVQGGNPAISYVANAQNGLGAARLARDVSNTMFIPRLIAGDASPLSTMFQGNNRPFTVIAAYRPSETNTGYIWSAGDNSGWVSLISRQGSATLRKGQNGGAIDVDFGGQPSGMPRIIAAVHTGTHTSVWDTSLTKVIDNQAQGETPLGGAAAFCLFAQRTGAGFGTVQRSMDFYECVIESRAVPDADVQQAIADLSGKWGIGLV